MSEMVPNPDIFDFSRVIERFTGDLTILRSHIKRHDHIADAEEVCSEIDHALTLFKEAVTDDGWVEEEAAWNAAWDYVRDNMRKWWD